MFLTQPLTASAREGKVIILFNECYSITGRRALDPWWANISAEYLISETLHSWMISFQKLIGILCSILVLWYHKPIRYKMSLQHWRYVKCSAYYAYYALHNGQGSKNQPQKRQMCWTNVFAYICKLCCDLLATLHSVTLLYPQMLFITT